MGRRNPYRGRDLDGPHEGGPRGNPRRGPKLEEVPAEQVERLFAEARRILEAGGYELVAPRIMRERRLRFMIERAGGLPVTIGDCEAASRALDGAIRAVGLDPGTFELEVESPGADRPLAREVDFQRFTGQQVTVTLREAREGRRNFTGKLVGFAAGDVTVHVLDEEAPQTFPRDAIREVRLHPEVKTRPDEPRKR